ncbi:putative protein N(5)-glutamine methyltransferase [Cryobacterium frigoriphilum]|uniref:peptide chain release factor N(5)-glutamine methyltransferase n=1 Tax=Cryobacterium frigoriphilum TaxID=1259150 RepID=A0A4R9AA99_9MICO|nr:putative protein N(5)-glutamine methyltransferase [Cryobacterium frigoriphilum]TFD55162.1 putative protein N(5)-glutamine methyltransferase [Cryobacterium frigoriphilum]
MQNTDHALSADLVARLRSAGCVLAEDEARLLIEAAPSRVALDALVARRVAGHPLEYVLGWAQFHGLRVWVTPGVFVPRRRTEFLVDQALALATAHPNARALDLCCGSGAVGAALVAATLVDGAPTVDLYAADIDPVAVACARRNLADGRGQVFEGDLYAALPTTLRGTIGILLANAPYVPTDALRLLPTEARLHEPQLALDGGVDGLDLHRRVAAEARRWLAPGGTLLIETSEQQAEAAADIFLRSGLTASIHHDDDLDATTVTGISGG